MREILFRGKTGDGKWIYGDYQRVVNFGDTVIQHCIVETKSKFDIIEIYKVIPESVAQFTGLIDKNGKKIFEGDIVTGRFLHSLPINSFIAFRNGAFGLLWDRAGAETFDAFTSLCNIEYEVIGNIHDNPELLGE
jgi:hypothetical protein